MNVPETPSALLAALSFDVGGTGDDSTSSPIAEKRLVRDMKEKALGTQLAAKGDLLSTLKHQIQERETEISTLNEKCDAQAIRMSELEGKMGGTMKSAAEHSIRYCEFFEQMEAMENQLSTSKKIIMVLKESIEKAEEEKQELETSKANIWFSLNEAKRIIQFTADKVIGMQTDSKTALQDLHGQIDRLKFQLTEASRISKWIESQLIKARKLKDDVELEGKGKVANLQFQLTESSRITNFVARKLEKVEGDKRAVEAKVAQLEFKLTESNRVCKFVESKFIKTDQDKKQEQAKVQELEKEMDALNLRLQLKNALIECQAKKFRDQAAESDEIAAGKSKMQSMLSVAVKMTDFLQGALAKAEQEKSSSGQMDLSDFKRLGDEIEALREELECTKSETKSLRSSLALAQGEEQVARSRIGELQLKVQAVKDRLAEEMEDRDGERQIKEQSATIEKLSLRLEQAESATTAAAERVAGQLHQYTEAHFHETLVDLEFRLTQSEVANETLRKEKVAMAERIRILERTRQ